MASPSPTLAVRFGFLTVIVFGGVAIIALALAAIFFIGLRAIPPASLAVGLLVLIALFVAVALTIVLGGTVIVGVLAAVVLFLIVAFVSTPAIAVVAVLLFLVLLALTRAALGTPASVPFGLLILLLLLIPLLAMMTGNLGAGSILVVIAVLGFIALGLFVAWLLIPVHPLPIDLLLLGGLRSMPTVPLSPLWDFIEAVIELKTKEARRQPSLDGLTDSFVLGGTVRTRTASANTFLFGDGEAKSFSLDLPAQFNIGWTTANQIDVRAAPLNPVFAAALVPSVAGAAAATALFWPNIATYWSAFGILPIELITPANVARYTSLLAGGVPPALARLIPGGTLFGLDMSVLAGMDPPTATNPRFSPSTVALFTLTVPAVPAFPAVPAPPTFTPVLIQVSDGANTQIYTTPTAGGTLPGAWVYAMQALKASTTVWGIWLGHVYRYHTVIAPMQMAMRRHLPRFHRVRRVLGYQSKFLIGFDMVLLLDWSFPPPTPAAASIQFLQLTDAFSARPAPSSVPLLPGVVNRLFGDDHPETALAAQGLAMLTFSTPVFRFQDINLPAFVAKLTAPVLDPVSAFIVAGLSSAAPLLSGYAGGENAALQTAIKNDLNALLLSTFLRDLIIASLVPLHPDTLLALLPPQVVPRLNRMLLADFYPAELAIMQWSLYPVAHYKTSIFRAAIRYATALVGAMYPVPGSAALDTSLQRWLARCATEGNLRGLPIPIVTNTQLISVLGSFFYRITAHGLARLEPVGQPGLSWVGNFPPCLESSRIPDPRSPSDTAATTIKDLTITELLAFLPKTGTIGEMLHFIFTFGFTDPIESLIPPTTSNTTGGPDLEARPFIGLPGCDAALAQFRAEIIGIIRFFMADQNALNAVIAPGTVMNFSATDAVIHQWERNIEL